MSYIGLSVVFVTYNSAGTIDAAVKSVKRHLPDAEIIVVDNGSQDDTCALVRDLEVTQLLDGHGNIGFGAGVNRGARAASGDLLLVLNPDAAVTHADAERLASLARRSPIGMLGCLMREGSRCRHLTFSEWGWRRELCWLMIQWFLVPREATVRRRSSRTIKSRSWVSGAAFIVNRAEFLGLGGFDEHIFLYFEDVDLSRRYREYGAGVGATDAVVAVHEGQGSSPGRHEQIQGWALLSFLEIVTKWSPRDGKRAARAAISLLNAISNVGRIVGALPFGGQRAAAKADSASIVRSTFLGRSGAPPLANAYPRARACIAAIAHGGAEQDQPTTVQRDIAPPQTTVGADDCVQQHI